MKLNVKRDKGDCDWSDPKRSSAASLTRWYRYYILIASWSIAYVSNDLKWKEQVKAPFTRYNRLSNGLSNPFDNGFDNRLYRVNGV